MACHGAISCGHIDPSHLWSSSRHVWWICAVRRGHGVSHSHLAYCRILAKLHYAVCIPRSAGSGTGSVLAIEHHDPWPRLSTRASQKPRLQHLRRLCRVGVFRRNILLRALRLLSHLVVVFFHRGYSFGSHGCLVVFLHPIRLYRD